MSAPEAPAATEGANVRLVVDPVWGYRRVEPLPTSDELDRFYESGYHDLISKGGRAPELARLVATGPDAERERAWLEATVYADVVDALEAAVNNGLPRRSLEIGCGTGELLRVLTAAGWEAIGVEPATEIANVGRAAGLQIEAVTAAEFLAAWRADVSRPFTAIMLMNVLEHVPEPGPLVAALVETVAPGGRVIIRVPNDFNPLQAVARDRLGHDPWWITVPDHLNYFDHTSAAGLLERVGLEVLDQWGDYPMELFLLMGEDYVGDRALGHELHERRRRLEFALEPALRRQIGRAWASTGLGRNTIVVARHPGS
jgi:SAM-dependent methyltransferase